MLDVFPISGNLIFEMEYFTVPEVHLFSCLASEALGHISVPAPSKLLSLALHGLCRSELRASYLHSSHFTPDSRLRT